MLRDSLAGRFDALIIPTRMVEYSLTESALLPFQAEPTPQRMERNCFAAALLPVRPFKLREVLVSGTSFFGAAL